MDWRDSVLQKRKRAPYRIILWCCHATCRAEWLSVECRFDYQPLFRKGARDLQGEERRSGLREWRISSLSGRVGFFQWHPTSVFFKILFKILEFIKAFLSISRKPYVLLPFLKSYFTKRHFLPIRKHRGIEFQSHIIKSSRWQFSGFGKSSEQITYGNASLRAPRVSGHCRFCAEVADHELKARDSVPISFADRAQRKTQRKACSMGLSLFSRRRSLLTSTSWIYIRFSSCSDSDICYWGESLKNYFLLSLLYLCFQFTFQEA